MYTQTDSEVHVGEPVSVGKEGAQPVTPIQPIKPRECEYFLLLIHFLLMS